MEFSFDYLTLAKLTFTAVERSRLSGGRLPSGDCFPSSPSLLMAFTLQRTAE
jgi:hypothetical protein